MSWRLLNLLIVGGAWFLVGAHQQREASKDEDERCQVFVVAPESDEESWVKVVKEIKKKIESKKKWFRLAEDSLGADIRVEVTKHGNVDDVETDIDRTETSQGAQKIEVVKPGLLDIEPGYFIEFHLMVTGQFRVGMLASGRSVGSAAEDVARRVRTICETYCR